MRTAGGHYVWLDRNGHYCHEDWARRGGDHRRRENMPGEVTGEFDPSEIKARTERDGCQVPAGRGIQPS